MFISPSGMGLSPYITISLQAVEKRTIIVTLLIPLKKPNLRRCIRAESLKLKGVDYDSSLAFDFNLRPDFSALYFRVFAE